MKELQKSTAQAIVNVFETGRVCGDYAAVTVIRGDTGHLSYGRSQAALGSGSLYALLRRYCQTPNARYTERFLPLMPRFQAKDVTLDNDGAVRDLLEEAAADPAMREAQDSYFDDNYWQPACRAAQQCGLNSPLGVAVVYDSHIQGGFRRIRDRVKGGANVSSAFDEGAWIRTFIEERKAWLQSCAHPLPNTVYRMNEFTRLIQQERWQLELPMRVRGVVIDEEALQMSAADPAVVAARAPDPAASSRVLQLTQPYMRGDDVRALQIALRDRGFAGDTDGTFGPMTEILVKQFQRQRNLRPDGMVGPTTWAELAEPLVGAAAR